MHIICPIEFFGSPPSASYVRLRSERKVTTRDLKSRHRCLVANVPSHLVLTNVLSEHHAASSVRILSIAVFTSPRIYIFAQGISTKIAD